MIARRRGRLPRKLKKSYTKAMQGREIRGRREWPRFRKALHMVIRYMGEVYGDTPDVHSVRREGDGRTQTVLRRT